MSRYCKKPNGKQLASYHNEDEARSSAKYVTSRHKITMIHYSCDNCGFWHLAPLLTYTPSIECHWCTDSNGELKRAYETKPGAKRRAAIIEKQRDITLYIYECPYGCGWHLTRQPQ